MYLGPMLLHFKINFRKSCCLPLLQPPNVAPIPPEVVPSPKVALLPSPHHRQMTAPPKITAPTKVMAPRVTTQGRHCENVNHVTAKSESD